MIRQRMFLLLAIAALLAIAPSAVQSARSPAAAVTGRSGRRYAAAEAATGGR